LSHNKKKAPNFKHAKCKGKGGAGGGGGRDTSLNNRKRGQGSKNVKGGMTNI